jgi:hypothetical protein
MKRSIPLSCKHSLTALLVFFSRLRVFPANFSPLGSFGFFSQNWLMFFGGIIIFDAFVGGFYKGWELNYLGFLMYPLLGKLSRGTTSRQLFLLPVASLLFFFFSNLGVWWYWFPRTTEGLLNCYLLALPFYRSTLIGDLIFGYGYLAVKYILRQEKQFSWRSLSNTLLKL